MSQLILTRGTQLRRGTARRSLFPLRFKVGPQTLVFSLVVFVGMVTLLTLMNSTKQATKGSVVANLEAKRSELVRDYEVMTMQLADVQSMAFIQQSPKFQSMVRPSEIIYVHSDAAIAVK